MHKKIYGLILSFTLVGSLPAANERLRIVSSLPDFASIAEQLGGDRVETTSIASGSQDPHFVQAKPSYARLMNEAHLFLTTGMDLELWVPALIDKSRNPRIREGEPGYVSVSAGMSFLEVPQNPNRAGGDIHIYGNPHIHTDPLKGIQIAENITLGLQRVDPANRSIYQQRLQDFKSETYRRLWGTELIQLIGAEQLATLSQNRQLDTFLDTNEFNGTPLRNYLRGWFKRAECLQGRPIIAYHKNWIYFTDRFGLEIADYVEHKPGIPPSARHIVQLVELIESRDIRAIVSANYYDEKAAKMIENRTGAKVLIVPFSVGGTPGAATYFDLFDIWFDALWSVYPECQ